jgi:hypothetical protein
MAAGGKASIEAAHDANKKAIEETGIGIYYGSTSLFARFSTKAKMRWIEKRSKKGAETSSILERLKGTDCIHWALQHVRAAYVRAGRSARFDEIASAVAEDDFRGTALARALQEDGWTAVFIARDLRLLRRKDVYGRKARQAIREGIYHGIRIDDFFLDYRPASRKTKRSEIGIEPLRKVGFFFGLVQSGRHTFVGTGRNVSESHHHLWPNHPKIVQMRRLDDPGFDWDEGVLMIPPGQWPFSSISVEE